MAIVSVIAILIMLDAVTGQYIGLVYTGLATIIILNIIYYIFLASVDNEDKKNDETTTMTYYDTL